MRHRRQIGRFVLSALGLSAATGVADATRRVVAPASGPPACVARGPVVLTAGTGPRRPLRIDVAGIANRRWRIDGVTQETAIFGGKPDGPGQHAFPPSTGHYTFRTTQFVATAGVVGGRVPVTIRYAFPGAPPQTSRVREVGFFDDLNGGTLRTRLTPGGTPSGNAALRKEWDADDGPVTDHLPVQALGIGAAWRITTCDMRHDKPAREVRTYTLQSRRDGVIVLSYREIISLDPARVRMASAHIKGLRIHISDTLVQERGVETGTTRIPIDNALAQTWTARRTLFWADRYRQSGMRTNVFSDRVVDVILDRSRAQ
jgi:hypothetical protein